jgi:pyrimidine deaminase RibD-like protein
MRANDFQFHDTARLDQMLRKLVHMIVRGQELDDQYFGLVAACVIDNQNRIVCGLNAERVALDRYREQYGEPESGSIIVTTLSPCVHQMDERYGESCLELINGTNIHKVYCGYSDPTQVARDAPKTFSLRETRNPAIRADCKIIAHQFLDKV